MNELLTPPGQCRHVIMNICVVGDYAVAHSIGGTQFFRGTSHVTYAEYV